MQGEMFSYAQTAPDAAASPVGEAGRLGSIAATQADGNTRP